MVSNNWIFNNHYSSSQYKSWARFMLVTKNLLLCFHQILSVQYYFMGKYFPYFMGGTMQSAKFGSSWVHTS